ncbi:MAG: [FeFe] hydrogenase H-cluster radical SAM maturase HydG [Candidatus Omnitrophica bacterium CG12_big_fil_rev_8_21_14_0_65_43_15]|uniref:[FeFe] hydrogenase H-cluster radical SAM maturase HydG n=1 Tax=Candidatus Taenaricola geysiri TaxID=1974752 RepID=A0A2J0LG66_9BACT|nr:MAG: [FeFe] hydrogenase H-cluster radical SAM maturase HydG [Candidatus Omnitrophica bacterium CG10_big_fil_rev_8_21_14_0_10_43_8]PIW66209.1 MAG: [FeFe] hydrogenase H-cluster radical SAM maturase HydG [Candidatus Omnitrophica bacterium CG12_big_fil_rev_8_21_14_0_65_43_15]PJC46422.1 MAG: [FeFe] hydrogenase H-cluster radical SAM maturase HydG [Candidatus Omnitrophica bacterium CG_4_9_14_0_2_um_filter_43_12]
MAMRIINEKYINSLLAKEKAPSEKSALAVIRKALRRKGLSLEEAAVLINAKGIEKKLFDAAARVKKEIYGERVVFFAPLYASDYCVNDCKYCSFHVSNKLFTRKQLTMQDLRRQINILINMGHKRTLLEFGEHPVKCNIDYVIDVINTIYSVKNPKGNIRRINVNIAPTTVKNYRRLKKANIGTYQLFQETYHRPTYKKLHKGLKRNYNRQITAHIKAFKAGIDDFGIGVLFGLYDWRFEVLSLVSHAQYLDKNLGVGPHTISVPRFRPAPTVNYRPEYPVSDKDFLKIIAILRLSVPYTGMILSTRETPAIRRAAFKIGISQASAASVTSVGGYGIKRKEKQFRISDERPLGEVIMSLLDDNMLPSFCTACYRLGRTGHDFMDMAKPGDIQNFCRPNGLMTFAEYLEDFAVGSVYRKGYKVIKHYLNQIKDKSVRNKTKERLLRIKQGIRDLYF